MSQLNKSTTLTGFKRPRSTNGTWPTAAALNVALTRLEGALGVLEQLADALEEHLGVPSKGAESTEEETSEEEEDTEA